MSYQLITQALIANSASLIVPLPLAIVIFIAIFIGWRSWQKQPRSKHEAIPSFPSISSQKLVVGTYPPHEQIGYALTPVGK
jgi:type II secretory pathway component PulF